MENGWVVRRQYIIDDDVDDDGEAGRILSCSNGRMCYVIRPSVEFVFSLMKRKRHYRAVTGVRFYFLGW